MLLFRSPDTLDDEVIALSKIVSDYFLPDFGLPTIDNVIPDYVRLSSDVNFNAIGSLTARKIAEKVTNILWQTSNKLTIFSS